MTAITSSLHGCIRAWLCVGNWDCTSYLACMLFNKWKGWLKSTWHTSNGYKWHILNIWISGEQLLRAVHLPKLWNIADDLKENSKSWLIEFGDETLSWNMMNKKEDELLTGNDLDSRVRVDCSRKNYVICYRQEENQTFRHEEWRFCFNSGKGSLKMAPWL